MIHTREGKSPGEQGMHRLEASRRLMHEPSAGSVPHPHLSRNCLNTSTMHFPLHSPPPGLPFLPTWDQPLASCCLPSSAACAFPQ